MRRATSRYIGQHEMALAMSQIVRSTWHSSAEGSGRVIVITLCQVPPQGLPSRTRPGVQRERQYPHRHSGPSNDRSGPSNDRSGPSDDRSDPGPDLWFRNRHAEQHPYLWSPVNNWPQVRNLQREFPKPPITYFQVSKFYGVTVTQRETRENHNIHCICAACLPWLANLIVIPQDWIRLPNSGS
jgi:hypothetical protein